MADEILDLIMHWFFLIVDKYHPLFCVSKKDFCKFLNGFSLTKFKDQIKEKHGKEVKR